MSAETFTTAMFLITAVIAAGVLINAVFPVVYTMAGTFQSATHESDQRLRTDFKIVTTFGKSPPTSTVQVWMKNVGSQSIPLAEIQKSDVFCGEVGNFGRLAYVSSNPASGQWTEVIRDAPPSIIMVTGIPERLLRYMQNPRQCQPVEIWFISSLSYQTASGAQMNLLRADASWPLLK